MISIPQNKYVTLEGDRTRREIRYRMTSNPLFVRCCRCTWRQRESGSAFALNAMIEADRVTLLRRTPVMIDGPTNSGLGQQFARCPKCSIAVWSHYSGSNAISYVRVGTLDDTSQISPDIQIFTSTKQPWVTLNGKIPIVENYYERVDYWPQASLDRVQILIDVLR